MLILHMVQDGFIQCGCHIPKVDHVDHSCVPVKILIYILISCVSGVQFIAVAYAVQLIQHKNV